MQQQQSVQFQRRKQQSVILLFAQPRPYRVETTKQLLLLTLLAFPSSRIRTKDRGREEQAEPLLGTQEKEIMDSWLLPLHNHKNKHTSIPLRHGLKLKAHSLASFMSREIVHY
jgi:hypothetical protein